MHYLLGINTIIFTLWGYQMSYIEFFGTIFNIWCVWLTAKGKISCWPIGIVGIFFYLFLFYQIQLYSDFVEQIYFLIMSFYGWWVWLKPKYKEDADKNKQLKVSYSSWLGKSIALSITFVGTVGLAYLMGHIHLLLPKYFPLPASFPWLDAFTTVMSFMATVLMARKKIESWYLWILVDIIGVGLYFVKGVKFISLEYLLFLGLAINGLFTWRQQYKDYRVNNLNDHDTRLDHRKIYATTPGTSEPN